jgi:hypothetical protein
VTQLTCIVALHRMGFIRTGISTAPDKVPGALSWQIVLERWLVASVFRHGKNGRALCFRRFHCKLSDSPVASESPELLCNFLALLENVFRVTVTRNPLTTAAALASTNLRSILCLLCKSSGLYALLLCSLSLST